MAILDREFLESRISPDSIAETQLKRNRSKPKTSVEGVLKSRRRNQEKSPGLSAVHAEVAARTSAFQRP
jgi:hypothetical protein